ncbi:MAG: HTTM domain-containing protein, partial [Flavobacteriales bacterium]|nr:HTTM domain-containing protein [Flavobacteriales bacterium]
WRVMLMEKAGRATFYVSKDGLPGEVEVCNATFLTPNQEKMMSTQPDMMVQYAQLLKKHFQTKGHENPSVRAEVWVTLNGSGSRLFIDPTVDLTRCEDGFSHKDWIIPSNEVITLHDYYSSKTNRLASH